MMRLEDLRVVLLRQRARRELGQAKQQIDAQAHVRREDDGQRPGDRRKLAASGFVVPGGPDHEWTTPPGAGPGVDQRRRRPREVDRDLGTG